MANKWTQQLMRMEGAVKNRVNQFAPENLLRSPSPSVNWLFGKNHGLPFGYSLLAWGAPKGGKSLLWRSMVGQMHKDYPDAIAVSFDTEFRDEAQLTEDEARAFGIDLDRYVVYQVNKPSQIFDRFHTEMAELLEKGAPIKAVAFDSINGIRGRREAESTSVDDWHIGDFAQTVGIGLKSILETQRRYRLALVITAQERAEMDMWEQKRGNKTKAAVAFAVKHHCEYFMNLERNRTAAGSKNELEQKLVDTSRKGLDDQGEQVGHKIRVWMQDSSMGPINRVAEFTVAYGIGVVNQHEEVFRLGTRWSVIGRPNPQTYVIGDQKFTGKPACLQALAEHANLQKIVLDGLKVLEAKNAFTVSEQEAAEAFAQAAV